MACHADTLCTSPVTPPLPEYMHHVWKTGRSASAVCPFCTIGLITRAHCPSWPVQMQPPKYAPFWHLSRRKRVHGHRPFPRTCACVGAHPTSRSSAPNTTLAVHTYKRALLPRREGTQRSRTPASASASHPRCNMSKPIEIKKPAPAADTSGGQGQSAPDMTQGIRDYVPRGRQ
jgi:hypothetical protein